MTLSIGRLAKSQQLNKPPSVVCQCKMQRWISPLQFRRERTVGSPIRPASRIERNNRPLSPLDLRVPGDSRRSLAGTGPPREAPFSALCIGNRAGAGLVHLKLAKERHSPPHLGLGSRGAPEFVPICPRDGHPYVERLIADALAIS